MKIRSGFVSNSSSSSYLILIPEGFDVETFVYSKLNMLKDSYRRKNPGEYPRRRKGDPIKPVILPFEFIDDFIKRFKGYIKSGSVYEERNEDLYTIQEMMNDLILGSAESGSDNGSISFVKQDKVMNIINNYKQNDISMEKRENMKEQIKSERNEFLRKKEEKKAAMRHIDPFDEEKWS